LHLLEKLKYEFIEREKPLFFHGDKGDKYYIVLKGIRLVCHDFLPIALSNGCS